MLITSKCAFSGSGKQQCFTAWLSWLQGRGGIALPKEMRDGDWPCPGCGNINFSFRCETRVFFCSWTDCRCDGCATVLYATALLASLSKASDVHVCRASSCLGLAY